jgi:hypothetical protein
MIIVLEVDRGKKYVTFIDFTPTQGWYKHIPFKRFMEAITMTSKNIRLPITRNMLDGRRIFLSRNV